MKEPKYKTNIIVTSILWIIALCSYNVIWYCLTDFPGNVYVTGTLIGIADLLGIASLTVTLKFFSYKSSFTVTLLLAFLSSILFLTISTDSDFLTYSGILTMR